MPFETGGSGLRRARPWRPGWLRLLGAALLVALAALLAVAMAARKRRWRIGVDRESLPTRAALQAAPVAEQPVADDRGPAAAVLLRLPSSRRARSRSAVAASLVVALGAVLAATMAVGRTPAPASEIDPRLLTRIVPESVTGSAGSVAYTPAPVELDAVPDFSAPERSFGPRPAPRVPQTVGVIVVPTPTPVARARPAGHRVTGVSSWYCQTGVSACHYRYPGGMYAAAGPALRVGDWRGRTVRVCSGGRCVYVKLIDWCGCYGTRVIDLYSDAFRQLAPLSEGTIAVTVSW